jgi:hypothetical protein
VPSVDGGDGFRSEGMRRSHGSTTLVVLLFLP